MRSPTQPPPCLHPHRRAEHPALVSPAARLGILPSTAGIGTRQPAQGSGSGLGPGVRPPRAPDTAPAPLSSPLRSVPSLPGPLLRDRGLSVEAAWEFTHKGLRPTRGSQPPQLRSLGGSAWSPPASSLHLVAARAWSHEGPKEGSQGPQQGKGSPRGRGTGPEQGCGVQSHEGAPHPFPQLALERRVTHSLSLHGWETEAQKGQAGMPLRSHRRAGEFQSNSRNVGPHLCPSSSPQKWREA